MQLMRTARRRTVASTGPLVWYPAAAAISAECEGVSSARTGEAALLSVLSLEQSEERSEAKLVAQPAELLTNSHSGEYFGHLIG